MPAAPACVSPASMLPPSLTANLSMENPAGSLRLATSGFEGRPVITTAFKVDPETSTAQVPAGENRIAESVATPAASVAAFAAGNDHCTSVPSLCSTKAQEDDGEVVAAAATTVASDPSAGPP